MFCLRQLLCIIPAQQLILYMAGIRRFPAAVLTACRRFPLPFCEPEAPPGSLSAACMRKIAMSEDMKNMFRPAGRIALITGGTSGLGHAIAEAFLQNGVDVAVCSRHPDSAPELAELAAKEGRRYLPVRCDITKEAEVDALGEAVEQGLGPATMLVNSAGMNILKPAEDYDQEAFEKVMALNVTGTHLVSKMAARRWMIPAHKGRIVNLSSAKAFLGTDRDYAAYCASKGAVNMYTSQLGCEWAKFGITVNAIAPTFVITPINADRLANEEFRNSLIRRIPIGRLGTGRDMAAAALFLCSEGAEFITGVTLKVDGGVTSMQ